MQHLRLVFLDNSWNYDGRTPENHPLGGSQSALVYLTRSLAALGHDVHVFNNCPAPGTFAGVHYHKVEEIAEANKFLYSDAFISLRNPNVFRAWINAGVRILWAQDAFDQPMLSDLKKDDEIRGNTDCIFCISRWQAWTFLNHFHWPARKIFITRNAVWPGYFQRPLSVPHERRLVYTSTPFRGLELLLRLFPEIRRQVPDSELHVFSSMGVYNQSEAEDQKNFKAVYELARQPGVLMHGSIGQKDLAEQLAACRVCAYPNTFPETSCIAVMEALAAGCAVVTSHLAALPETVGRGGRLIYGIPGTKEYNEAFIDCCVRMLTNDILWQKTAAAGKAWILSHFTWDKIAQEWSDQIARLLNKKHTTVDELAGWTPIRSWRGRGES